MSFSRRTFLGSSLASSSLVGLSWSVPTFLRNTAQAAAAASKGRVLVVVQLSGGNDGLNTVIPYTDPLYNKNRIALRISRNQVVKINDTLGLHPGLAGFGELLEQDNISVLQGIGYPNPSRSHFRSMDIWHTASNAEQTPAQGWLGRAVGDSSLVKQGVIPALHIGNGKLPLALIGRSEVPTLESLQDFKLVARPQQRDQVAQALKGARGDSTLQFLQRSTLDAYSTSSRFEEISKNYDTPVNYPGNGLSRKLKMVAQMIDAGIETPVYYVSLGGFDTHANQAPQHNNLMNQLGSALSTFWKDLSAHGHARRVLVMTFSEFGRRVKENGSRGTDHGAGAPMFLLGSNLKRAVVGDHPRLDDLDSGDLKHHTDFRSVYASVLEDWLKVPSKGVLGANFPKMTLFAGT